MPNMIPTSYLNETLMDTNEILVWGKQEPRVHPYMFWYTASHHQVDGSFPRPPELLYWV